MNAEMFFSAKMKGLFTYVWVCKYTYVYKISTLWEGEITATYLRPRYIEKKKIDTLSIHLYLYLYESADQHYELPGARLVLEAKFCQELCVVRGAPGMILIMRSLGFIYQVDTEAPFHHDLCLLSGKPADSAV